MSVVPDLPQPSDSRPFSGNGLADVIRRGSVLRLDPAIHPAGIDPAQAQVVDGDIQEGRAVDGHPFTADPPRTPALSNAFPIALTSRPYSRRPAPRGSGLRLLPLEGFVWGTRDSFPRPRTRPDNTLIWVTHGMVQLDFPRQRRLLGAGEVRYIPAGTAFAALPLAQAQGVALLLAPDLVRSCEPALPTGIVAGNIGADAAAMMTALHDMADEHARAGTRSETAIACHLSLLAIRLARLAPPAARPATPTGPRANLTLVQQFIELAAAELGDGRTVGDMADDLGVTTAILDRACMSARGYRAIQLIHELRHERAVKALRHTNQPSAQIARDLGYASVAHFNRAFVAATGRLPEPFRKQRNDTD